MKIIEYSPKYAESVKDLLVELQAYIADADSEKRNILTENFREKYFEKTAQEVNGNGGKIFWRWKTIRSSAWLSALWKAKPYRPIVFVHRNAVVLPSWWLQRTRGKAE